MINSRILILLIFAGFLFSSCGHSRKLKKSFPAADVLLEQLPPLQLADADTAKKILEGLKTAHADYSTFNARVKVNFADANGEQPEGTVVLRMKKDSAIWLSVSGTLLNLELYRIFITPDSVIILNKLDKTVEYLPFTFLQDFIHFPLTFSTLQNLITGNLLYADGEITGFQSTEKNITMSVKEDFFSNLIQTDSTGTLLRTSSIVENRPLNTRTLHLSYDQYQLLENGYFSFDRFLRVDDESQIRMAMNFQKPEFNNELSLIFNVPANYKTK